MVSLEELRTALHRDPRGVAEAATAIVADARADDDTATLSKALTLRGRARRSLGDIDLADADLREALVVAATTEDNDLVADAHVALAGVLSFAGKAGEAFDHLDIADQIGSANVRVYSSLQRAIIHQRLGHMDPALAGYEAALPTLRRLDARTDLALVLMNRGVIRTQSGDYDGAVADLGESRAYFRDGGNDFGVAQTLHGLGWAYSRSGDLPRALAYLGDAATAFRALGHEGLEVDVDRVEALLAAGLAGEAASIGAATAKRMAATGNRTQAAEVWLLCARAAQFDGDPRAAQTYASRAQQVFARADSTGWERAARLEMLRSDTDADATALTVLADELDTAGNARGAAAALALASLACSRTGRTAEAAELAERSRTRARQLRILEVDLLAAHADAVAALTRGDRAGAKRVVRRGLDGLDSRRSALAATDARASIGAHARELAALGLRIAAGERSAAAVLTATERARAGRAYDIAPARPSADPTVATVLAELRSVAAAIREREAAGEDTRDLLHQLRDQERTVHEHDLRVGAVVGAPTGIRTRIPTTSQLAEVLGGRMFVSLIEVDGRLLSVRVGPGRARRVELGCTAEIVSTADALTRHLRTTVLRETVSGARVAAVQRAAVALDTHLTAALAGDSDVVLVVPAALHAVPWRLPPSLAGRSVTVAPSATWWYDRTVRERYPANKGSGVVVAGPRLAYAGSEARAVAACHPGATLLIGPAATVAATVRALADAPFAHVAAHSRIRRDNPLWTSLELADGPLCVYDLEQTARTPGVVVLSGCETGVGVRAGDELLGLSSVLLHRGTTELVASVCPLPDTPTTQSVMTRLHEALATGSSAARALVELTASAPSSSTAADSTFDWLVASTLVTYGLDRGS